MPKLGSFPYNKISSVQEKNIDYNHLSPSWEPNVALTAGTMACLVLTARLF
ncbi:MAG: hypothetical protein LBG52_01495 [Candidatus Peribacteria bacterium]|nr:hypothetical protein [Candidatus Peribacteria bacterium]